MNLSATVNTEGGVHFPLLKGARLRPKYIYCFPATSQNIHNMQIHDLLGNLKRGQARRTLSTSSLS